jgi:hypothetical protein
MIGDSVPMLAQRLLESEAFRAQLGGRLGGEVLFNPLVFDTQELPETCELSSFVDRGRDRTTLSVTRSL